MEMGIELVLSFSELRTGMKVLEIGCDWCARSHVHTLDMLIKHARPQRGGLGGKLLREQDCYVVEPLHGALSTGGHEVIGETTVEEHRLFRFLDLKQAIALAIIEHERVR